jgi:membrane-associated phospholipid phosphatase
MPTPFHAYLTSLCIAFLIGIGCGDTARAQAPPVPAPDSLRQADTTRVRNGIPRRLVRDGVNLFSTIALTYAQPLHWQKKDFLKLGGVVLLTGGALLADEPLYRLTQRNRNKTFDALETVGDFFGKPQHNYPVMLALWGSGVLINNDWLRDTGLMVIASVSASGLVQSISKEAVGRARPVTGLGSSYYKPFGGVAFHSFPSGHTMLAIATSWVLARQVKWVPLKIVFYSVPVLTGLSRVYDGAHWFSDIVLGSALGIACAESVLRLYPKMKEKNRRLLSIMPAPTGVGITLRY